MRSVIDKNYARAVQVLTEKIEQLHIMAKALLDVETINADQIDDIMNGRPMRLVEDQNNTPFMAPLMPVTPPDIDPVSIG